VKVWICKGEIYGKPDFYETAVPQRERAKPKAIKSFRKKETKSNNRLKKKDYHVTTEKNKI
jgi:hypothetical protein